MKPFQRRPSIGVFYLARGADDDALSKIASFLKSYRFYSAGADHKLYIIYKGFAARSHLVEAKILTAQVPHEGIFLPDTGFDLGAYFAAASRVNEDLVCFFNTASEISSEEWLQKLFVNLDQLDVGIVGASGSYEAPQHAGQPYNPFPNPHLRTNAFLIDRRLFLSSRLNVSFVTKLDAHLFEHGTRGLAKQLMCKGLKALIVGKNGRGYEPAWWVKSVTFRQGAQSNLLVKDNQTNAYAEAAISQKKFLFNLAWGDGSFGQVTL